MKSKKEKAMDIARKLVLDGLRDGTVKISIAHKCSECGKPFDTVADYKKHLVEGKIMDSTTGKKMRVCPN